MINKPFLHTSLPAPMAGRDFFTLISPAGTETDFPSQTAGKGGHAGTQTKPGAAPEAPSLT
ncbi:hypothetical protein C1I94_02490 [Akkermansia muciniphila]|nr:hypothetical protein CUC06_02105 [Akkermansia muciniphila]MBE5696932.1 hypothetical protein [Akkermansia sp.]OLA88085.1 MAG: hypothetical protein BHW66_09990 [Akkermansia sp. 54_46]MBE5698426.1 hypothetical protein [Akkermansia sp.]MCO6188917.1 hypothetical protein [Akkermansia muciniphila]